MVTPDPASVASVLDWASFLQDRVEYLIVKNSTVKLSDFGYWETDFGGALAHADESPVLLPFNALDDLRINPLPVIPKPQSQCAT